MKCMTNSSEDNFFAGLKSIVESAFPKKCPMCGKVYNNEQDFINDTKKINNQSGLKQSYDDEQTIVELYRNCSCGSTLMNFFGDRRNNNETGEKQRAKFGELHDYLVNEGLESTTARNELLKAIRGEKSEILKTIKFPQK
jgi:hypothetical protein